MSFHTCLCKTLLDAQILEQTYEHHCFASRYRLAVSSPSTESITYHYHSSAALNGAQHLCSQLPRALQLPCPKQGGSAVPHHYQQQLLYNLLNSSVVVAQITGRALV